MFQQFLMDSSHLMWPLFSLVLFFFTFVAVVVILFAGFRKSDVLDHLASLPLQEDGVPRDGGSSHD